MLLEEEFLGSSPAPRTRVIAAVPVTMSIDRNLTVVPTGVTITGSFLCTCMAMSVAMGDIETEPVDPYDDHSETLFRLLDATECPKYTRRCICRRWAPASRVKCRKFLPPARILVLLL
jgi:hypothetical protein